MIAKGNTSVTLEEILSRMSEADILAYYLNVYEIPTIIQSPLRQDKRPSFGLYSIDGKRIYYTDLSTKDRGGIFDLLGKMWNCSYLEVLERINKDIKAGSKSNINAYTPCTIRKQSTYNSNSDLQCKVREWKDYDIEYWASFGISLEWLKWCRIFPISFKIVTKNTQRYIFKADKYAYAFIESKDSKVFIKVYQPFNKFGYKWYSNMNRSVWGLWTKIPQEGDNLIITSSVKDALNIMCNLKIPAICMQGEGYSPKPQVIEELKKRYKNIIVFYDNDYTNPDNPGRKDSIAITEQYNLKRVEIPEEYKSKDPSDLFKNVGKIKYLNIMQTILKPILWKNGEK